MNPLLGGSAIGGSTVYQTPWLVAPILCTCLPNTIIGMQVCVVQTTCSCTRSTQACKHGVVRAISNSQDSGEVVTCDADVTDGALGGWSVPVDTQKGQNY